MLFELKGIGLRQYSGDSPFLESSGEPNCFPLADILRSLHATLLKDEFWLDYVKLFASSEVRLYDKECLLKQKHKADANTRPVSYIVYKFNHVVIPTEWDSSSTYIWQCHTLSEGLSSATGMCVYFCCCCCCVVLYYKVHCFTYSITYFTCILT